MRRTPTIAAITLAALTLAAAAARFTALGRVPPGFHVDEAFNVLDARAVIAGWRPLFLPANAGRDVLYTYAQALLLALFGDRVAVARAASALVGTLTVPLVWWMARTVERNGGVRSSGAAGEPDDVGDARAQRVALTAAALLAASYWHLHFSRFGIRAILLPAFVAIVLARWWVAATAAEPHRRRRAAFDAGVAIGLAAYAHPVGRALIALPFAHALWWIAVRRVDDRGRIGRPLAITALTSLVVALPLLGTWLLHPWQATGHAAEVSILGDGVRALAANAVRVAGLFVVRGDAAGWRNLPGRPAFDIVGGGAFLVGVWITAREAWRRRGWAVVALLSLVGLALPSALTDGAPNFSRAIGALPPAVWLAAVGAVAVGDAAARRVALVPSLARAAARLPVLVPVLVVAFTAASTARAYRAWAADPATPVAFDADILALAPWLDSLPDTGATYMSSETADHATYRAAAARPAPGVDVRRGLVVPLAPRAEGARRAEAGTARYVDIVRLPWAAAQTAALEGWSTARLANLTVDTTLGPVAAAPAAVGAVRGAVVRLDAARALRRLPQPPHWDERITFVDATLPARVIPGGAVTVTLAWLASGPTGHSLSTAVQLNTVAGRGIANGDGLPVGGSYPTDRWRDGEIVLSRHTLRVPADAPPGPAVLRIGWYILTYPDGPTGAPHVNPITDDQGRPTVDVANAIVVPAGEPSTGGG